MSTLSTEASAVLTHLCSVHVGYRMTTLKKIASELLLHCDATAMCRGRLLDLNAKNIGAGVYKVWLSDREQG